MKVDRIITNASIFTSTGSTDATSLAIAGGKFVYVGPEQGLTDFEGPIEDMSDMTIVPSYIDSHVHLPACVANDYVGLFLSIFFTGKADLLAQLKKVLEENPDESKYTFLIRLASLQGEPLTYRDLDTVSTEKEIYVVEDVFHNAWANTPILKRVGYNDDTEDITPGLSYLVRDEEDHITGWLNEGMHFRAYMRDATKISREEIEASLQRWIDFCLRAGVSAVFEAGTPGSPEFTELCYEVMQQMDLDGKLPIHIEGSYMVYDPAQIPSAIDELVRLDKKFNSPHLRVRTLKILNDGILNAQTACLFEPYLNNGRTANVVVRAPEACELLVQLDALGYDLHVHCVGDVPTKEMLDAVELAQEHLGRKLTCQVTLAHLGLVRDQDVPRFKELGIIANYSPWWHSGCCITGGVPELEKTVGPERAHKMHTSRTMWETGTLVNFSSDNTSFGDFGSWNPLLGVEVGATRMTTENTNDTVSPRNTEPLPPANETMTLEQMFLGYTINGAIGLRIDDHKGSIEAGKDADFVVYDQNVLSKYAEGLSFVEPIEAVLCGKTVHKKN